MKNARIIEEIENFAPLCRAEEWDNVGLMVGSRECECTGVMVALDVTMDVAKEAAREGCNLVVSHHPLIFKPMERIDVDTAKGALVAYLIKNGISVYSAHTNLDKADEGINFELATALGGKNIVLAGAGALFDVDCTLGELAKKTRDVLGDDTVVFVGEKNKKLKRAFVVSGAGGSEYDFAKNSADVFITGELKHHQMLEAKEDGLCLVGFSHYYSEIIMQEVVGRKLDGIGVKILRAASGCPFRRMEDEN